MANKKATKKKEIVLDKVEPIKIENKEEKKAVKKIVDKKVEKMTKIESVARENKFIKRIENRVKGNTYIYGNRMYIFLGNGLAKWADNGKIFNIGEID